MTYRSWVIALATQAFSSVFVIFREWSRATRNNSKSAVGIPKWWRNELFVLKICVERYIRSKYQFTILRNRAPKMIENAKNAKNPYFDPPSLGPGTSYRHTVTTQHPSGPWTTILWNMDQIWIPVFAVAYTKSCVSQTLSLRISVTDGRADLVFEPTVGGIAPYKHIQFERFVSSRFRVIRVEKSYFVTLVPEVGVVISTSG